MNTDVEAKEKVLWNGAHQVNQRQEVHQRHNAHCVQPLLQAVIAHGLEDASQMVKSNKHLNKTTCSKDIQQ